MDKYQHFKVEDFIADEYFIEWILRPNPNNIAFWENWLSKNEHRKMEVDTARQLLGSIRLKPIDKQLSDEDIANLTKNFNEQTQIKKSSFKILPWLGGAAAAVLLAMAGFWWLNQDKATPSLNAKVHAQLEMIVNKSANSRLIQLPDQSIVVLKPQSSLQFPTEFSGNNREVSLTGEAFFEIHPDAKRPFFVKAGRLTTMVLGTSFDVISPSDGSYGSVVVKTGKVKVFQTVTQGSLMKNIDSVILLPNQKVISEPAQQKLMKQDIATPLMLSYAASDKVFSFNNAPLSEIISKLEEAYGVSIQYNTEKFKDLTVTASLSRLPLEEKIRAICKAIDAKYKFEEQQIEIY